jgi:branched-subunit amino acid aminotransferase/4-amino-4-deoxychorismate lyase
MRGQVLTLARVRGWLVREGEFTRDELARASELWLTNSLIGIRPVAMLAGRQFDAAYPYLDRLRAAWREAHGWDPLLVVNAGR